MNAHYLAVAHSDEESDDPNIDISNEPLLLSSSATQSTNAQTVAKPLKTWRKSSLHKFNENRCNKKSHNRYDMLVKLNPLTQKNKTNRFDYKQINRDKWKRCLNIGVITFASLFIIYLCFSMSLRLDKQPEQITVDIPPIDETIVGPKGEQFAGNAELIVFCCVVLLIEFFQHFFKIFFLLLTCQSMHSIITCSYVFCMYV